MKKLIYNTFISRIFDIHPEDVTDYSKQGISSEVDHGILDIPAFKKK